LTIFLVFTKQVRRTVRLTCFLFHSFQYVTKNPSPEGCKATSVRLQ
jgi:hypothetical protein